MHQRNSLGANVATDTTPLLEFTKQRNMQAKWIEQAVSNNIGFKYHSDDLKILAEVDAYKLIKTPKSKKLSTAVSNEDNF